MDQVTLLIYRVGSSEPFTEWLDELKDRAARAKIWARLARIRTGNFGDCRSVGSGVFELRVDFGPGYRVYYGHIEKNKVILLLGGGNKAFQRDDIASAKERWQGFEGQEDKSDEKKQSGKNRRNRRRLP